MLPHPKAKAPPTQAPNFGWQGCARLNSPFCAVGAAGGNVYQVRRGTFMTAAKIAANPVIGTAGLAALSVVPPENFRQAMAQITAAVHVITTSGPGGRRGLTASAVTSLSDTPAMMLACIHADSQTLAAIEASGTFCINALSGVDQEVGEVFAGRRGLKGEERFAIGSWSSLTTGAPSLTTALINFDCRLIETRLMATHRIVIGQVVAVAGRGYGESEAGTVPETGLIYRNRRFGKF